MTVLYVNAICKETHRYITEILAASENETELEREMFRYCDERDIKDIKYYHGEYFFVWKNKNLDRAFSGWFFFKELKKSEEIEDFWIAK